MPTNDDVLRFKGEDVLFVVTRPPDTRQNPVVVDIALDQVAAVRRKDRLDYQGHVSMDDIRNRTSAGDHEHWLLSGGTLIIDDRRRIAVGLRDGNSDDPFVYTNIGAGKCDQPLLAHCLQELQSEFMLCLKHCDQWYQVDLAGDTQPVDRIWGESKLQSAKPDVWERLCEVCHSLGPRPDLRRWLRAPTSDIEKFATPAGVETTFRDITGSCEITARTLAPESKLQLRYLRGGTVVSEETFPGLVFPDEDIRTIEFRLVVQFDLSAYPDNRVFYSEGTGYGAWKSREELKAMADAQKPPHNRLITPFLEWFVYKGPVI